MEPKANHFLETERISKLMARYAVPCIISLLVAALYNIVDQIFIANADYLGSYGNAANTVVFPLTVVALALAVLIGDGCCAFVSLCLGAGEKEKAHKSVGNAILLCLIISFLVTGIYLLFQDPILTLFGGQVNEETFSYSKEYFVYIFPPFHQSAKSRDLCAAFCTSQGASAGQRRACGSLQKLEKAAF